MKILLVEPNFPIPPKSKNHKNFLPIGLLKIASYLRIKKNVKTVKLIRGNNRADFYPDEIWITSLFTYWSHYFWDAVKFYREIYPKSIINVGGIYVSLHFDRKDFKEKCKTYNIRPHFGIFQIAEQYLPDYSMVSSNPHPLDYQIIHSTRSCPRHCKFCYTWKIEPKFTSKRSIAKEICSNKLIFYDNNLLMNEDIDELLAEIASQKWQNKYVKCESQSGFDGRILQQRPELAKMLRKARFINPRIAWDWKYSQWKDLKTQIDILRSAGYQYKDISVFMIYNWNIPYIEMEKKRKQCWKWNVQITDCRYRPIKQQHDYFNSRLKQKPNEYHIHTGWTDKKVKEFRRKIRKQNICVRHGFPFHSSILERKIVPKYISMELRQLPYSVIKEIIPDAWFPNRD